MTGRISALILAALIGTALAAALLASVKLARESGSKPTPAAAGRMSGTLPPSAANGENAAAATVSGGPLLRGPARGPLSGLAAPLPPAPPPDPDKAPRRWRMVHQAVATAAGVLEADGLTMVLPGIDVVANNEICVAPGGQSWPCGMAARTAFRAFLRGRSLNCHLPDSRPDRGILAECLLMGEDPAQWLVKNGWARAKENKELAALARQAEISHRGIFGPPPH